VSEWSDTIDRLEQAGHPPNGAQLNALRVRDALAKPWVPWRDRIMAARARGRFTDEDRALAQTSETCAFGEQVRFGVLLHFNFWTASPPDRTLACYFTGAVRSNLPDRAEAALEAIATRALELKRLDAAGREPRSGPCFWCDAPLYCDEIPRGACDDCRRDTPWHEEAV
jgi:hypothetical protein